MPTKVVAIYGLGLIGGSLGLALRNKGYHRIGIGRNRLKLTKALRIQSVDEITTNVKKGVRRADIVVLALPVDIVVSVLKKIKPWLLPHAVVTDVGSIKTAIMKGARRLLASRFVGSHPMAGSEKSGITHARKNLFFKAGCVITSGDASPAAIADIRDMWQKTGAQVVNLDEYTHDYLVALCSHLPHVIAFALMAYMDHISKKYPALTSLLAGSFRDSTRVAMSDPHLWAHIVSLNKKSVVRTVREFNKKISRIMVNMKNPQKLERMFSSAVAERTRLENKFLQSEYE